MFIFWGFWIALVAVVIAVSIAGCQRHQRGERERALHTWAHIRDKDAQVVASDGLVRVFGQGTAAQAQPLGRPQKIRVAGTGRAEWRLRFHLPDGPFTEEQTACVFVWKEKGNYGDWFPHHITVRNCKA